MADRHTGKTHLSERHVKQRAKNWFVLLVIIGICVLFFAITIVRFGDAGVFPGAPPR
ncbi:hypothetical protein [Reyranella sp. CPCC 100927]|uniref:hypothetical protein n=1 Tax=Reyranella sp. CPCC 100927 TaxID=2599616 RepID=UPI0015B3D60F|nr:hypothetical protein [Reyranella sp. CPCC 100927]